MRPHGDLTIRPLLTPCRSVECAGIRHSPFGWLHYHYTFAHQYAASALPTSWNKTLRSRCCLGPLENTGAGSNKCEEVPVDQQRRGHGRKIEGLGKRRRSGSRRWRRSRVVMTLTGVSVAIQTAAAIVQLWSGR